MGRNPHQVDPKVIEIINPKILWKYSLPIQKLQITKQLHLISRSKCSKIGSFLLLHNTDFYQFSRKLF